MRLYEGFEEARQRIQDQGWVRRRWESDGRVCVGESLILAFDAQRDNDHVIPGHVAVVVDEELSRRSPYYRHLRERFDERGIQDAIVAWNDIWWRRKKAVVSLLEALAYDHEVAYLRWRVTILEGQVASFCQEIEILEGQVASLCQEEADRAQLAKLEEELAWSWERLSCLTH